MDDEQFLNQVFSSIDDAEVLTIFFLRLRKSLIVDLRSSGLHGPYVEVAQQVGSMEERVAIIEKTHPELGRVHNILSVPWMGEVRTLEEQGVVERIMRRLTGTGMAYDTALTNCERALNDLRRAENRLKVDIIKGSGFETIWQATE